MSGSRAHALNPMTSCACSNNNVLSISWICCFPPLPSPFLVDLIRYVALICLLHFVCKKKKKQSTQFQTYTILWLIWKCKTQEFTCPKKPCPPSVCYSGNSQHNLKYSSLELLRRQFLNIIREGKLPSKVNEIFGNTSKVVWSQMFQKANTIMNHVINLAKVVFIQMQRFNETEVTLMDTTLEEFPTWWTKRYPSQADTSEE